jgi:DNA-binding response OmpR family regulator
LVVAQTKWAPFARLICTTDTLQVQAVHVTCAPNMTPLPTVSEVLRPRSALVVEDHPDTQSALAAHLEQNGWEVAVASDGEEALRIARKCRPRLICVDLNLPNISGYDVCEQIRDDPVLEWAIVIMVSARTSVDVRANSLEAGADAYVAKPYDADKLLALVEHLCRHRDER